MARGELAFGLTDTDDAYIEKTIQGMPVEIVFPDQGDDGLGALFIPNTLAIIKGSPHTKQAQQLINYLLSPEVEERLARSESAQIPLHRKAGFRPPIFSVKQDTPADESAQSEATEKNAADAWKQRLPIKPMDIDFHQAADQWDTAAKFLKEHFASAQ